MATVPHKVVGLERMLEYGGVRLQRFHSMCVVHRNTFGSKVRMCGHVFPHHPYI